MNAQCVAQSLIHSLPQITHQKKDTSTHKQAIEKAENEYEKYRVIQDQKYISSMDEFYNKYLEENNN